MATSNGIHRRSIQRYGWVPDLPDARDYVFSAPDEVIAKLPPKVDLRSKCPPVYDQGQLGRARPTPSPAPTSSTR